MLVLSSSNIYSENLTDIFNASIEKANLAFTQSSINPYTNSIDKSEGRIIRSNKGILVFVDTPFMEKYELYGDEIIVTDIELDQISRVSVNDFGDNTLLDIFTNGITNSSSDYELEQTSDSIIINSLNNETYNKIEIKFKESKIHYLKYNDNLDIENLIIFKDL